MPAENILLAGRMGRARCGSAGGRGVLYQKKKRFDEAITDYTLRL